MGITKDEVTDCVVSPEAIGFSDKYSAVLLSAGRVTLSVVVTISGHPVIATILYRRAGDWEAAYAAGKAGGAGRSPRRNLSHLS